jgi:hypothetical protein
VDKKAFRRSHRWSSEGIRGALNTFHPSSGVKTLVAEKSNLFPVDKALHGN